MRGALCLGLLAGCGDARAVSDGASSVTSAQTSISVSEATPTTGAPILDLGAGGCGLGNGDLGLSFIWIANSTQGTVSKIDTVGPAEVDAGAGIRGLTRPSPAALQRRRLSVGGPRPRA